MVPCKTVEMPHTAAARGGKRKKEHGPRAQEWECKEKEHGHVHAGLLGWTASSSGAATQGVAEIRDAKVLTDDNRWWAGTGASYAVVTTRVALQRRLPTSLVATRFHVFAVRKSGRPRFVQRQSHLSICHSSSVWSVGFRDSWAWHDFSPVSFSAGVLSTIGRRRLPRNVWSAESTILGLARHLGVSVWQKGERGKRSKSMFWLL